MTSILFIDSTVPDYQSLINGIEAGTQVVLLDPTKDGVAQISTALQGGSFDAVHIVSHGTSGNLQLGTAQLNSQTIQTTYSQLLQQWSNSLTPGADILLYGCNVAQGESGKNFVQQLSQVTGADITASDDATGSVVLGGDWNLEYQTGTITAPLAFQIGVLQAYNSVLAPFTKGNLVVVRVGTGSAALSSAATAVFLDEYTVNGTLVQSIGLPTAVSGSNARFTLGGSNSDLGALVLSADKRYLTLGGYDANLGTANVTGTTASSTNRIVARVDANGTIDTTTRINNNNGVIRTVVTDDGTRFWTGGNSYGVFYTTLGNTSTSLSIEPSRVINIFNGQLYISQAFNSSFGVSTVGIGLPTSGSQTLTLLPGLSGVSGPYGFILLDRDASVAGIDTLYIADQSAGLLKYSFNGTTWTARGSIAGVVTGLTGFIKGNNVDLYATRGTGAGNTIVKFTDSAAFNANISGSFTTLATAATNTAFRSLAFAPSLAIEGTPNKDILKGTATDDTIYSLGGNDYLIGLAGDDYLDGGTGDDYLFGGLGNDAIIGNDGNDLLYGNEGNDSLNGGLGNDNLDGGTGNDLLIGGLGSDIYTVDSLSDIVVENLNEGTDKVNSYITLTLGNNLENLTLLGNTAINGTGNGLNNHIIGNSAANTLNGGDGDDWLMGKESNDTLNGGNGNDRLDGGVGNDTLSGGAGNDLYEVDSSSDIIIEAADGGTDTVISTLSWTLIDNLENLSLIGNQAIDGTGNNVTNRLIGNGASNTLTGLNGNDYLSGEAGNDVLIGGAGNDTLVGGLGADIFDLTGVLSSGFDTIVDFKVGEDIVRLSGQEFGLPGGTLNSSLFVVGTGATTQSDRFIYNQSTGALFYDADGSGSTTQAQIALFSNRVALTAGSFAITGL